ncbi:hypothetical protein CDL15_Pgr019139 [Punica granatum]|uniref:Uncharacterized protein n=1 Tax=Punica granatum TaxID=22663 RepID=A0A218XJZ1_PUNGR|nr:hypothetical protein CDL15_Pgr019139 [Punica granatum]
MATDFLLNLASGVIGYTVGPIARQVGYALLSESYMNDLQDKAHRIGDTEQEIQHNIEEARTTEAGNLVERKVLRWSATAAELKREAEKLIERKKKAAGCCGCVANPMTRYKFGRKAKRTALAIQDHLATDASSFGRITYRPSQQEGITPASSSQSIVHLQSRDSMLQEIMQALADDTVSRIGVHGVGGVGKTTLLSQVEKQARASKEYVEVVAALVSQNPELKKIQGKIHETIERVRIKAQQENDKKNDKEQEPKTMRVVIILDDLWKKLDLEEIGIKEMKDDIKVKLVMTSRYRHVLADEMHCRQVFHLEKLKNEEALKLFANTAGNKLSDPLFKHTAEELAKKCEGLPLLIDALAKVLQNSDSPKDWEDALEQLKNSDSVHKALELSFRHLVDSQVKLLSIISGVDVREGISDETLLRYGVGLGLLAGSTHTMEAARGRMRELLDGLRATSLLLDCGDNCVKAHDVVREAVISIAARDQYALVLRDKKDLEESDVKLCESKEIFLPYPDIRELPCIWECSELEILVLFAQEDRLLQVPYLFFTIMPKLKVLHFARACFKPLPSSIRHLKNLQTLCLEYCDLEDVRFVRELKNLQVLSFMGSNITQLPKEVGELAALRSLDLSHCSRLEVIEPGSLEGLVQLEELYLEKSFVQWHIKVDEKQCNASISELNKMYRLSNLDILIPDVDMLREDLQFFWKLDKYRVLIGDKWKWSEICKGQRTLMVTLKGNDILSEEWLQLTLRRTEDLHLHGSDGTKRSIHGLCREGFKELKHLHVERSPSTHYLVRSTKCAAESAFIVLESLFLENLSNLEKICHGLPAKGSFERLKIVRVHGCQKLKNLFSLALLRDLRNLEEIEVIDCGMMQEIVVSESTLEDDRKDKVAKGCLARKEKSTKDDKIKLHGLRRIKLEKSRKLTTFFTNTKAGGGNLAKDESRNTVAFFNSQQVLLPCLESLELLHLPKLTGIWQDQHSVEWSKLKYLRIEACRNLLKVVDSSKLIMKLESLESLSIKDCKSIEEVFDFRGVAIGTVNKILPRLHALELEDLPSLRCLWNTTSPEELSGFRNLGSLKVDGCSGLRCLFTAPMVKAMATLKELEVSNCGNMETIVMEDSEDASKRSWFSSSKVLKAAVECPGSLMFGPSSFSSKHVDGDKVEGTTKKAKDTAENIIAFPSLRMLNIHDCYIMKSFVLSCKREQEAPMMAGDDSSDSKSKDDSHAVFFNTKVKLPKLAKLEIGRIGLKELSLHTQTPPGSLQSFRQPVMFSFPEFHGGPSFAMKRLQRLERLTCLEIYDCQQRNLFTSSQVKCLRHLRRLKIESCDILENVITNGEALATGGIVFPCLTNLKLHDLPELCSFYHERHTSCKESHEQSGRKDEDSLHHQIQPSLFWVEQVSFPSLEKLAISSIGKLKMIWHGQAAPDAFSKLTEIKVERCNKLEHVFESDMLQSFVNLEKLRITDCSSLSVIYDLQGLVVNPGVENAATTAHLKELELNGLRELKHIWNGDPTGIVSFQNLSTVDVTGCGSLAYLFPASLAESLLKLEKLSIRTSSQLEVVVADDEVDKVSDDRKLIFPQLEDLTLEKLQELKSFHSGRHILQFPLLKKLTVEGVGDLVELLASDFGSFSVPSEKGSPALQQPLFLVDKVSFPRLEELSITGMKNLATIWHGQMTEGYYFTKLKEIIVKGCDALVTIFPPNTVHALRKLEKLHVISCPSLRVIYHMQGLTQDRVEYSGQVVVGAQLKELLLQELPKLEHIWNIADPGRILSFHNLDSVKVEKCETLKYVFPPSVAKVLYNLNELWIENNRGLEEIVAAAVEKVEIAAGTSEFVFPRATSLKLSGLLGLKSFCQRRHISKWPSLEELEITSCDRIQNLFCHIDFFQEAAGNSNDVGSPPQQTLFFVDKVWTFIFSLPF